MMMAMMIFSCLLSRSVFSYLVSCSLLRSDVTFTVQRYYAKVDCSDLASCTLLRSYVTFTVQLPHVTLIVQILCHVHCSAVLRHVHCSDLMSRSLLSCVTSRSLFTQVFSAALLVCAAVTLTVQTSDHHSDGHSGLKSDVTASVVLLLSVVSACKLRPRPGLKSDVTGTMVVVSAN